MLSMTGYGKAEYLENGINLTVEIKTVNNRNLDFNCKMPRAFIAFEDTLRKTVQSYVGRGRVDLFINFSDTRELPVNLTVDIERAKGYYNASCQISKELGLPNDCTTLSIMKCPDVVTDNSVADYSFVEQILVETVASACENLNHMRKIEGEKLVSDMLSRMDTIKSLVENVKERAPLVVALHKEKLKLRIEEALNDVKYDETRLLNEVAFFVDKVNIDEELTRLNSHITQFKKIVSTVGAGKKLDFLMQEFNRETNTICSKSNDIIVTDYALSLKNEIEKVREQVQNLE